MIRELLLACIYTPFVCYCCCILFEYLVCRRPGPMLFVRDRLSHPVFYFLSLFLLVEFYPYLQFSILCNSAMSEPPLTPTLPTTHPLILELSSLRAQLSQYQHASHQTSIQLQSARLELALTKENEQGLLKRIEALQKEVDVLRANPAPPPIPPTSTALTELSLAHRRLSSKLDFAESQLAENSLQLAHAQQEIQRLIKEMEGDRAVINELRRVEDEREEEIEWERSERRKVEEQKKLV